MYGYGRRHESCIQPSPTRQLTYGKERSEAHLEEKTSQEDGAQLILHSA